MDLSCRHEHVLICIPSIGDVQSLEFYFSPFLYNKIDEESISMFYSRIVLNVLGLLAHFIVYILNGRQINNEIILLACSVPLLLYLYDGDDARHHIIHLTVRHHPSHQIGPVGYLLH